MSSLNVILYEGAGAKPLDPALRAGLVKGLLDKGYSVQTSRASAPPPAAGLTFALPGDSLPANTRSLEGLDVAAVVALAEDARRQQSLPDPGKWKPWFPVIDYKRCTNCMQCLSFCLFDVYGVTKEGKIHVQNETNCKTDCPACSRVCPEVAILFPKYKHGPIHGGEVNTDDIRREAMKVDISALLGGDVYSLLRDRSAKAKSRFSKERDEDRALKERLNCLNKLQSSMDIPSEVLSSLPGVDEIRARAEAAKRRAEAALAANTPSTGDTTA